MGESGLSRPEKGVYKSAGALESLVSWPSPMDVSSKKSLLLNVKFGAS